MSPQDTILGRVKKLLAMTVDRGATPEEAATAAAKAQALLFEHNLTMAQVETHEHTTGEAYGRHHHDLRSTTSTTGWRRTLLFGIAKYNFCKAVYHAGRTTMEIVGKASNVEVVIYMEDYLHREIERLARAAAKPILGSKQTFVTAFCRGAVSTIISRLAEQRRANEAATATTGTALMVIADQALAKAFESYFPVLGTGRATKGIRDSAAYNAGRQAGHTISLHQGIGRRSTSNRQLA